jgi:biopolymer transport protein ExbD
MRVPSVVGRADIGINLTPMIDVVFQLIIFFLVSSHLAKQEAQMVLPLPVAETGEKPADSLTKRLTLNVLADGSLVLAGRQVSRQELTARLAAAAQQEQVQSGLEIRVRGDRDVAYQHIEPVLIACARAGVWDVKFSVFRPEDVR